MVQETFIDVVPSCTVDPNAPAYEITLTYNEVEHITDFGDGRVHETFTQTGTFVAVPVDDPSLPTYTGHRQVHDLGGFNANGKTVNGTFTFTVHGMGSDARPSRSMRPTTSTPRPRGAEFFFTRCHD
jgi:hypothetical protein